MSNFRVGQKVICIAARSNWCGRIEKGRTYKVLGVGTCKCGQWIDVGVRAQIGIGCHCPNCGSPTSPGDVVSCGASLFRPLIEDLTADLARKAEDSLVHERPERVNEPQAV